MDNREANYAGHPPACTCKICVANRLERQRPGYYSRVPYGGSGHRELRGLNTADAERKGLLKWEGEQYVLPTPTSKQIVRTEPIKKGGRASMLRLPIKLAIVVASLLSTVLGAHGVWVYFSRLELLFGGEWGKLFLTVEVPIGIQPMIEWMSVKGVQSWVIPAGFIVLGLILWGAQSSIRSEKARLPSWLW